MSGPVDVLEVMDALEWGFLHRRCPMCAGWNMSDNGETDRAHTPDCPFVPARAAVAELIEAAKEASATLGHAYHTTLTGQLAEYAHTDYQRLDAALARVQGRAP